MRLGRPKVALILTDDERVRLDSLAHRSRTAPHLARRARIILACAEGHDNKVVAKRLRMSQTTVCKWRARFVRERLDGLYDEPRPGAPRKIRASLTTSADPAGISSRSVTTAAAAPVTLTFNRYGAAPAGFGIRTMAPRVPGSILAETADAALPMMLTCTSAPFCHAGFVVDPEGSSTAIANSLPSTTP